MNPILILMIVAAIFALIGVPYVYLIEKDPDSLFYTWTRYVTPDVIASAYRWTLYSFGALFVLLLVFGVVRSVRLYQRRPMLLPPDAVVRRLWTYVFAANVFVTFVMFVQAGFTIPLVRVLSVPSDFWLRAQLRSYFGVSINQTLFNINLYLLAMFSLILTLFTMRGHWKHRIAAVVMFVVSASFTLDKSQHAAALFIVILYASLQQPIRKRHVLYFGVFLLILIVPFYVISAIPSEETTLTNMFTARVIYGEWMGLPYYLELFQGNRQSMTAILPPYVLRVAGIRVVSPARKAMLFLEPAAAAEGTAGTFSCVFPGEAYAVGGVTLLLLAPLIVAFQLWLIVMCFRRLPKTPVTVFLFSWFLYKFEIGLLTGFSIFIISSFTIGLALLVGYTVVREAARLPQRSAA